MVEVIFSEPRPPTLVLYCWTATSSMVPRRGIEPRSSAFQTDAFTWLACWADWMGR